MVKYGTLAMLLQIGAVDAPQCAKLVHLLDEAAQILVDHCTHP